MKMTRTGWMSLIAAGVFMAGAGFSRAQADESTSPPQGKFFCKLNGLTPEQRTEYKNLTAKLRAAVQDKRELEDGYAFSVSRERLDIASVFRWVDLERRCCPFFHFVVDVEPNRPTWLQLRGPAGVKAFIESAMASD
jgi:hypothetical protein